MKIPFIDFKRRKFEFEAHTCQLNCAQGLFMKDGSYGGRILK